MPDHDAPTAEPAPPAARITVWIQYLIPLFLWALGLILLLKFLAAVVSVGLAFLGAAILASAIQPLRRQLPGPRWYSAVVAGSLPALFVIGTGVVTTWLMSRPIREQFARWPLIQSSLNQQLGYWSERFGLEEKITTRDLLGQLSGLFGTGLVSTTANVASSASVALLLVFFGCIFLLGAKRDRLLSPVLTLLPPPRRPQLIGAINDLEPQFRWWLVGTLIAMVVTGVASYIAYWLLGLQFAGPLAMLAGLGEIVPNFGPVFAFAVAALFAAGEGKATLLGLLVAYVIVQGLESYTLKPSWSPFNNCRPRHYHR